MKNSIENSPFLIFGLSGGYEEYEDLYIVGKKGFYLKDNNLILSVLDEAIYWLPTTLNSQWLVERKFDERIVRERCKSFEMNARDHHRINLKNSTVINLPDDFLYIDITHPFGWYAFGHLHDSLQRLFNVADLIGDHKRNIKYLVSRYDRVSDFIDHLSALVGYKVLVEDLVLVEEASYYVKRVIKPYSSSVYTNFREDVYYWLVGRYDDYFTAPAKKNIKLYLSRNHIKPGSRGVLNENEFISELIAAGFVILRGDEPLSLIYQLFSSATLIIGAHGSLFANSIYAPENCKIIEFCPDNRVDTSFLRKQKKTLHYRQVLLNADLNFNIEISRDFINEILS